MLCHRVTNPRVSETHIQFRGSFFSSDGLKLRVRHILWPMTPWFTSPRNYLCASTPWPPPSKDNVTICLFNCLSVTLLQAFSEGVYGFFFHLYLFIYLAWRGGGCLGLETGSLCLGWFHMDINHPQPSTPPPFSAPLSFYQAQTPWICSGLEAGWSQGHCTQHFPWPLTNQWDVSPYVDHRGAFFKMVTMLWAVVPNCVLSVTFNFTKCHLRSSVLGKTFGITNSFTISPLQN